MHATVFGGVALFLPLAAYSAKPGQHDSIFPPWQHRENNDATVRGISFTVPRADDLAWRPV